MAKVIRGKERKIEKPAVLKPQVAQATPVQKESKSTPTPTDLMPNTNIAKPVEESNSEAPLTWSPFTFTPTFEKKMVDMMRGHVLSKSDTCSFDVDLSSISPVDIDSDVTLSRDFAAQMLTFLSCDDDSSQGESSPTSRNSPVRSPEESLQQESEARRDAKVLETSCKKLLVGKMIDTPVSGVYKCGGIDIAEKDCLRVSFQENDEIFRSSHDSVNTAILSTETPISSNKKRSALGENFPLQLAAAKKVPLKFVLNDCTPPSTKYSEQDVYSNVSSVTNPMSRSRKKAKVDNSSQFDYFGSAWDNVSSPISISKSNVKTPVKQTISTEYMYSEMFSQLSRSAPQSSMKKRFGYTPHPPTSILKEFHSEPPRVGNSQYEKKNGLKPCSTVSVPPLKPSSDIRSEIVSTSPGLDDKPLNKVLFL